MASLQTVFLRTSSTAARAPLARRTTPTITNITTRLGRAVQQQRRAIHNPAALARPPPPYKDDMDRESLKPKAHEYTGSGTDDQVAASEDAAFNPRKTSPEAEKEAAAKDNSGSGSGSGNGNPLEVSPANRDYAEAGRGKEEDKVHGGKSKASGQGKPPKAGKAV